MAERQKIKLQLSAEAERYCRRDAPVSARRMAAGGALPLPPVDLATVLFVLAVLVIGLTLLNMLIAIMTAVFDEAEDRAEARLYLCRARLILEFESAMGEREVTQQQREAWFPPFLHVMRPLKHEALQALFDEDGGLKKLLHHWPRFGANLASRQSQHSQHAAGTR